MLELKQIVKDYPAGTLTVHALKGVDLRFRTSEFVSILGPSGCGKTTLLNIIGGLDQYTSGDLVIDGVSTKDYKDRDWDTYRNHSIGFVFQTYNLIPHQTVLKNVELALTLAGVSIGERRERAAKALERVGLGDQLNKRPNQMSGGQMQRVAIARALVNNPDIILADEPTGALDTETGLQVMELLKEVARDRLVIMVTHNPELAEQYSSRIIRILDGEIVGDTAPMSEQEYQDEKAAEIAKQQANDIETPIDNAQVSEQATADSTSTANVADSSDNTKVTKPKKRKKTKKSSMSLWTAFKLSLTNLFTKKGRTFLTSFAGSIGIIGIALILSVSQGMTTYINLVEEQTLASYPLSIESTSMDLSSLVANFMSNASANTKHDDGKIHNRSIIYNVADSIANTNQVSNDLKAFKVWLEAQVQDENSPLYDAIAGLQYQYNLDLSVYTENTDGKIIKSDVGLLLNDVVKKLLRNPQADMGGYYSSMASFSMNVWQEMLSGNDGSYVNKLIKDQYDLVEGNWPTNYNEIVLVLNENNEISDISLYALGLLGEEYVQKIADSFTPGAGEYENVDYSWDFDKIMNRDYVVILNSALYDKNSNGTWYNVIETDNERDNAIRLQGLYDAVLNNNEQVGVKLKISGIIRPSEGSTSTILGGAIGYTHELTKYIVSAAEHSAVVQAQLNDTKTDILTGNPFSGNSNADATAEKANAFRGYYSELNDEQKREVYLEVAFIDYVENMIDMMLTSVDGDVSLLKENLAEQYATNQETGEVDEELKAMALQYLNTMSDDEVLEYIRDGMYSDEVKPSIVAMLTMQLNMLSEEDQLATINGALDDKTDTRCALYFDKLQFSSSTWEGNLSLFGWVDITKPRVINIYASTFDAKDVIAEQIALYNSQVDEEQQITYTDFVAIVMSAVTTIIDAVTYVLIAFVSISLIVSSIMIGVITLISVQERTKEIGILRAIGASKRDVSSMFNAETVIIGFAAGVIGVLVTYLLCIPINAILHLLTGIVTLNAYLPPVAALILIAISMLLTLISGLIPSRSAAKKDPVVALRTE